MDMKMTDPELYGICERFMKHEVPDEPGQELCGETRYLAILAVLMGSGAPEAFEEVLGEALESGVSPAWASLRRALRLTTAAQRQYTSPRSALAAHIAHAPTVHPASPAPARLRAARTHRFSRAHSRAVRHSAISPRRQNPPVSPQGF